MKNIHEGHYKTRVEVDTASYEGRVYACGECDFASPDQNELHAHLQSEARLAKLKNAFNQIKSRLAEHGLRAHLLRCASCGRPVHAANANNLQCNFCGGNLLEVGHVADKRKV